MAQKAAAKNPKAKSSEEIFSGFQTLRAEQRQLANKISELEMDLNEHKYVRTVEYFEIYLVASIACIVVIVSACRFLTPRGG